jgi:hypothetical protein
MRKDLGTTSIFKSPSSFKSNLYKEINDISCNIYKSYRNSFLSYYPELLSFFPYLEINCFPYKDPCKTITLSGILISNEIVNELLISDKYEAIKYGLKVFIVIPVDFKITGVRVFDYNNVINFEEIPHLYQHYRESPYGNRVICTHHKDKIKSSDPVLSVLKSAWYLYKEYLRYDKYGKFNLDCLPHTYKGSTNMF